MKISCLPPITPPGGLLGGLKGLSLDTLPLDSGAARRANQCEYTELGFAVERCFPSLRLLAQARAAFRAWVSPLPLEEKPPATQHREVIRVRGVARTAYFVPRSTHSTPLLPRPCFWAQRAYKYWPMLGDCPAHRGIIRARGEGQVFMVCPPGARPSFCGCRCCCYF